MANRNQKEREHLSRDREQPQGWFDPEMYRSNMERRDRDRDRSGYQQTYNPNLANRYDDLNRQRVQANYPSRSAFDRQYGRGFDDSRSTYNQPAYPSTKYGDSFDEGYSARGNQRTYREDARYEGRGDGDGHLRGADRYRDEDYDRSEREERGWWDRAADEVSSWFGDDDAERRRRMDKMKGPHRGKGPKGYVRTDEKLKDEINERLYDDSFIDASDVEVTVLNGEASLTGTVENKMTKRRIEDIVESIPGITDVENHIKVKPTTSTVGSYSPTDSMYKRSES